jgi:hypothetical protein
MAEANGKRALWTRRKVQIVLIGIAAVLALVIAGRFLEIPWEQVEKGITAIEWLIGLLLGAHTGTDIVAMLRGVLPSRNGAPPAAPEPAEEPPADDDDDDDEEPDEDDDEERGEP